MLAKLFINDSKTNPLGAVLKTGFNQYCLYSEKTNLSFTKPFIKPAVVAWIVRASITINVIGPGDRWFKSRLGR